MMIIKQIYTYNNYRNFNYLIGCSLTREAIAIDPLAFKKCLQEAEKENLRITSVINTHEHFDHIAGNDKIIQHTGAKLYSHKNAVKIIPNVNVGLKAGDRIRLGKTIDIEILDTPGHTMSHISLLIKGDKDSLFCGDTLFSAGVGNCHNGGNPESLYDTFYNQLINLNKKTNIYPGHDYLKTNLEFTLSLEPNNKHAKVLLSEAKKENFSIKYISTLEQEFKVNTFFRLGEKAIIESLKKKNFLQKSKKPKDVFLALRELRNRW